jgi:hypothetical protein
MEAISVGVANLWLHSGLDGVSELEKDLICQLLTVDPDT